MSRHNPTKSLSNRYLIGQLMYRYTVALMVFFTREPHLPIKLTRR